MTRAPHRALTLVLVAVAFGVPALAEGEVAPSPSVVPESAAAEIAKKVDVVERLNDKLPLDLHFADSQSRDVALSSLLRPDKPVVLSLVYYRCPTLCQLVLNGLVGSLKSTGLKLGEDYRLITLSIDPKETPKLAAEKRRGHLQALGYGEDTDAWTFLTGEEENIRKLADAVGFSYAWDADLGQFAHAAALFVITPDGRISRYLYGVRYGPRDLKLALVEAADGKVGTAFDRFLLTCYQFDPASKRYELYVKGVIQGGGLLIFFGLASLLGVLWRREVKRGTA